LLEADDISETIQAMREGVLQTQFEIYMSSAEYSRSSGMWPGWRRRWRLNSCWSCHCRNGMVADNNLDPDEIVAAHL
jgi:hypothetical protein